MKRKKCEMCEQERATHFHDGEGSLCATCLESVLNDAVWDATEDLANAKDDLRKFNRGEWQESSK